MKKIAPPAAPAPPLRGVVTLRCTLCRGPLALPASHCAACLAPAHEDCFAEAGRCGILGCGETTVVRPRRAGKRSRGLVTATVALALIAAAGVLFRLHQLWSAALADAERRRETDAARLAAANAELAAELNEARKLITGSMDSEPLAQSERRRETAEAQVARLIQLNSALNRDLSVLRSAPGFRADRKVVRLLELAIALTEDQGVSFRGTYGTALPPRIDGTVAAVKDDHDPPLVLLTVGADDGVRRDTHFIIQRGGDFIGKVLVEHVLRDSASARILFTKEGASIKSGDRSVTQVD